MATPDLCLRTMLAGIPLATPVVAAAGTCGYADELGDAFDLSQIGAVTTKPTALAATSIARLTTS